MLTRRVSATETHPLPLDGVFTFFTTLRLGQIVNAKRVCKAWQREGWRAVSSNEWLSEHCNRRALAHAPVRHSRHGSGEEAFQSLSAGRRVSKRDVMRTCKRIAQAVGMDSKKLGRCTERMLMNLFDNREHSLGFTEMVRAMQGGASPRLVFFADQRPPHKCWSGRCSVDDMVAKCADAGMDIFAFEREFYNSKGTLCDFPRGCKVVNGTTEVHRGLLVGFVVLL